MAKTQRLKDIWCFSVPESCPPLCDPMDCSNPGFPVLHYLSEFAQTHVHWVSDAFQPSQSSVTRFSSWPQSFPALESFPRRLFTSGGQNIGALAAVLPTNIQGWFPLELTGLISLLSKGISRVFSSTIFKRHICDKMWVTQQSNFQSMVENVYVSCSSIVKEACMWGLHWIWEAKVFSGLSRHWVIFFFHF